MSYLIIAVSHPLHVPTFVCVSEGIRFIFHAFITNKRSNVQILCGVECILSRQGPSCLSSHLQVETLVFCCACTDSICTNTFRHVCVYAQLNSSGVHKYLNKTHSGVMTHPCLRHLGIIAYAHAHQHTRSYMYNKKHTEI